MVEERGGTMEDGVQRKEAMPPPKRGELRWDGEGGGRATAHRAQWDREGGRRWHWEGEGTPR